MAPSMERDATYLCSDLIQYDASSFQKKLRDWVTPNDNWK